MSTKNLDHLQPYYGDFHIHIGRAGNGQSVKISGSKNLTFEAIAKEAAERKGIHMIGIIDCHSPSVQADIEACLRDGVMQELAGGGIAYENTVILLGCELEIAIPELGACHVLVYLRTLADMKSFTLWMSRSMKNVQLSSQRLYVEPRLLQREVAERGGLLIPAHIFTPYKGLYGSMSDRMERVLDPSLIFAVELGLSADTSMAGLLSELDEFTFLTNSDAHSLSKIGREYNVLLLDHPSYDEFVMAIQRKKGRRVVRNYGLDPRLGKYHRTFCRSCGSVLEEHFNHSTPHRCPLCGSLNPVQGVLDRILSIADRRKPVVPVHRPPYLVQVPLEFLPGLGKVTLKRLLAAFGSEMAILHQATEEELTRTAGAAIARHILMARSGTLQLSSGGGGVYGRITKPS
ncbi:endonuclease Q family protein [Paenibacillus sp. JSM ZJ436]|uniref:endonuclease Q family protein n=1 Tax=Paenibacillus sp. JSM ZJ436 TaxID=3376190 RepID=UPI0037983099